MKALKCLIYFSSFPRYRSHPRHPKSDLSICDYQSRFTAAHFIQFAYRRAHFETYFLVIHVEQIISHARESRRGPNEARALRYRIRASGHSSVSRTVSRPGPAAKKAWLALPFPPSRNGKTRSARSTTISQTKRRGGARGHFGGGNLVFQYVYGGIHRSNLFISGNSPFRPISHSPRLCSQRAGALFRRTLSPVSHHPDILHYTLARLIPRFIAAEEALRSPAVTPAYSFSPSAMTLRKGARYKTSTPPQHLGASFTARRFGIYRVICRRVNILTPARRGYFRPSGRVNFNWFPTTLRYQDNVDASRDGIKCIMPE